MGFDPKVYNPRAIRNKISSCKNEMIMPSDYEKYAVSDYEKIVLKVLDKCPLMVYISSIKSNEGQNKY